MKVAELKKALVDAKVEIPEGAKQPELEDLYKKEVDPDFVTTAEAKLAADADKDKGKGKSYKYYYWVRVKTYITDKDVLGLGLYGSDKSYPRLDKSSEECVKKFEGKLPEVDLHAICAMFKITSKDEKGAYIKPEALLAEVMNVVDEKNLKGSLK